MTMELATPDPMAAQPPCGTVAPPAHDGGDPYVQLARLWTLRLLVHDANAFSVYQAVRPEITDGLLPLAGPKAESPEQRRAALHAGLTAAEASDPPRCGALFDNIALLHEHLPMSAVEQEILAFRVLFRFHPLMRFADQHLLRENVTDYDVHRALAMMLGRTQPEIAEALSPRGALCGSGLLRVARNARSGSLREKLAVLTGTGDAFTRHNGSVQELIAFAVTPAPPATFALEDFPHLANDLQLLVRVLGTARRTGERGVNVLFHGAPGVGKTELARALARELGFRLYEVPSTDQQDEPLDENERFGRYQFSQRMLARFRDTLLLFDEIEDVFPGPFQRPAVIGGSPGNRKALINRTLEENPVPAIWIANHFRQMDPAYLRRFDLVLEVPAPPASVRRRILSRHLEGLVDEATLDEQARIEHLSPATAARAARVLRLAASPDRAQAAQQFLRLARQSMEAQGLSQARYALPADYDPRFMRANVDPQAICRGLARTGSGRLLFHGAPGTGKTAFAHYLARQLDRELRAHRGSDLLSMWVGGTEKQIARMFREAEGAIVLLDEADGFLRDRAAATRSWEVTGVNELLTQMELFDGIFIAATNFLDTLDPASLRRFGVKVGFDYLDEDQRLALFRQSLASAGGDSAPLPEPVAAALRRLSNLTPGDFAAVRRRQELLDAPPTAADLLAALAEESRLKPDGTKRAIGFASG